MNESIDVSFIYIQPDPQFNRQTSCIRLEIPTYNPVSKNGTQDGLNSKLTNSKITASNKVGSPQKTRGHKSKKEASKLSKKAYNSLGTKHTAVKTTKPFNSGFKKIGKIRGNRVKSLILKKAVTGKEKKPDVNKVRRPALKNVEKPGMCAKEGSLKMFPFLGDFSNRKIIYMQTEIPTYNLVWTNGTRFGLTGKQVNSEISASRKMTSPQKLSRRKSEKEISKLAKMASNTLDTKRTLGKTTKSSVSGGINVAKFRANRVKIPILNKSYESKEEKPASNGTSKSAANKGKKSAGSKTKIPATKQVKKPEIFAKIGGLKKPCRKTFPLLGDFSNRKIICMQSENPTYNPVQTNATQDVLSSGGANSKIAASSKLACLQKPRWRKSKKEASKLSKKASKSLGTKHTVGQTTKPSVSGYKNVTKIRTNKVNSRNIEKVVTCKEKKRVANKVKRPAANKIMIPGMYAKEAILNTPETNTLSFLGDIFCNCVAVLLSFYLIVTMLSVYIPKQTRY